MPSFPPPGSPSSELNSSDVDSDPKMLSARLLLVIMMRMHVHLESYIAPLICF